jgi:hypothetical protein
MRASRAYIASLSTTAVLVAAAVLLLLVVSGLVAFRGWPGDAIVDGLESVVVDSDRPSAELTGPALVAADAAPAAAAVAAAPADATPAGVPGAGAGGGGGGIDLPRVRPPIDPPNVDTPSSGPTPTSDTTPPPPPDDEPPTLTGQLQNTTRETTRTLGGAVGQTSPSVGQTVTDTGRALSDLVVGLAPPGL